MTYPGVGTSGYIFYSTEDDGIFDFAPLAGDVEGLLSSTQVTSLFGIPIESGTPQIDQILKYDGSKWSFQPDASGSTEIHALLGAFHSDTTSHAPVRGDIIVANSGGVWDALAVGTAGFVLYSDGTDVLYTRLGQNTPFELGTSATPSVTFVGDLDTGLSAQNADVLVASASGLDLLHVDGVKQNLYLNGGQRVRTTAVGADYTVLDRDYIIMCTAGGINITLPASPIEGRIVIVKDRDGNASGGNSIFVLGNGNTIDGNSQVRMRRRYMSFAFIYSGTEWHII